MPVKLKALLENQKHDLIEVQTTTGREKIAFSFVSYSPAHAYAAEEAAHQAQAAGEPTGLIVEALARLLRQLDLLDENDQPLAISRDNLMQIPFEILNGIFHKIVGDGVEVN